MAYQWNWEEKFRQEDEIIDMLENVRDNFPSAVAEELDAVWQLIRDKAIELCPKESGALASSIELESEGGSGAVSATSAYQGQTIYENAIYAGNDSTFNFEGQPTSQYADLVESGHMLPNGDFWEGTPFLEDAVDFYDSELEAAVGRALDELLGD